MFLTAVASDAGLHLTCAPEACTWIARVAVLCVVGGQPHLVLQLIGAASGTAEDVDKPEGGVTVGVQREREQLVPPGA